MCKKRFVYTSKVRGGDCDPCYIRVKLLISPWIDTRPLTREPFVTMYYLSHISVEHKLPHYFKGLLFRVLLLFYALISQYVPLRSKVTVVFFAPTSYFRWSVHNNNFILYFYDVRKTVAVRRLWTSMIVPSSLLLYNYQYPIIIKLITLCYFRVFDNRIYEDAGFILFSIIQFIIIN